MVAMCLSRGPSPTLLQVDMEVCPRRILVSNLPRMDEELLRNKLEIHFSKKKNGGGEVDCCEMRRDIWSVVITFLEENGESLAHQVRPTSQMFPLMDFLPSASG